MDYTEIDLHVFVNNDVCVSFWIIHLNWNYSGMRDVQGKLDVCTKFLTLTDYYLSWMSHEVWKKLAQIYPFNKERVTSFNRSVSKHVYYILYHFFTRSARHFVRLFLFSKMWCVQVSHYCWKRSHCLFSFLLFARVELYNISSHHIKI